MVWVPAVVPSSLASLTLDGHVCPLAHPWPLISLLFLCSPRGAEVMTYRRVLQCALDAANGMRFLHSLQPPICHRDLKVGICVSNVLLSRVLLVNALVLPPSLIGYF